MLKSLHVKNFALIDDLEIIFEKGLTAMTGETGAGKSIILESLLLLFAKRSDQTMIRHGEKKAYVRGVFELNPSKMDILSLPSVVEIEREVDLNGRHIMKVNGEQTTLSKLKEITSEIGSIHSQNDTMLLYDKEAYLDFIDQVDPKKIQPLLNQYLMDRSNYLSKKKLLENLKQKKDENKSKISYFEYQQNELKTLNLKQDEKVQIDEKLEKLKNFDKIMTQLKLSYEYLSPEGFDIDQIYNSAKAIEKIAHIDETYLTMKNRLTSAYYELDDVKSMIYQFINEFDFDQNEFDFMMERSHILEKIEQKYQKSNNELIHYLKEIEDEILMITDYDGYIEQSKKELKNTFDLAYKSGLKLREERIKNANILKKSILIELKDLDLEQANFDIEFEVLKETEEELLETGLDKIEFNISLNEGEPLKPLSKVASGGERARFMFALKNIFAKQNDLTLMILDEIDIGISGKTAAKVASKMVELSKNMQLIVITHLPQVAAKANYHYGIKKMKEDNRMVTRIEMLNLDQRIEMIATMLSDEKLSHFAIEQAKMLLHK
jgi:DNA repair protein RecN (Recombination protein N)